MMDDMRVVSRRTRTFRSSEGTRSRFTAITADTSINYSAHARQGIAEYCDECVCLSACVCVCVCVRLSVRDHMFGTARPIFIKFLCMLRMAVARFSSGGVVISNVLPVLWVTIFAKVAQRRRPAKAQRTRSLRLDYKLCAVIPVAGQRTHGITFRALKVTTQVDWAESAV